VIKKALIVCPVSLVNVRCPVIRSIVTITNCSIHLCCEQNWKAEFNKWLVLICKNKRYLMQEIDRIIRLGRDRVGVFLGDKDKSKIKPFIYS
jgi:hypothetical protein